MAQSKAARAYLVAFNLISFFGWSMILTTLLKYMYMGVGTHISLPVDFCEKLLAPVRSLRVYTMMTWKGWKGLPRPVTLLLDRMSTFHGYAGALIAVVQSLAIFEVVHAALGMVKTPVPTTVIQVASRLWLVWGISERSEAASISPFYTSMVFAWSVTECVRYPFYANALMGSESPFLQWARYTFFYILYPLGAGSEAILMFQTLPVQWPWRGAAAASLWSPKDYFVLVLFVLWWPGLYIMYTHMMRQRRRALGGGAGKGKKLSAADQKRLAELRKRGTQAIADATWATGETSANSKKSK